MDEIPPQVPGYRLTRQLGSGSTASVWRARRLEDDALVAIKLLPGDADEEAVREYTLLQQAASEHVVTLHETLALDSDEGPATALVLELLAGGSLTQVIAERGHLTPGETVTVIVPIAQALSGLHDLGVVHGDLSPGNVLLDSMGRPTLSDLGFSRLTGEAPGDVHGTDGYVAPEVLDGGDLTRAADVHALGALAWLCLVGAPPGHVAERIDLAEALPDVPNLVEVIESCLSSDPDARPEADEIARAVFDAADAQPLRMICPGDVASGLTRRIREGAGAREEEIPSWQRELAAQARGRSTLRKRRFQLMGRRQEPTTTKGGRHGAKPTRVSTASSRRRVGLVAAALLAVLLAVLVPWHQLAIAGRGEPVGPIATSATTGTSASTEEAARTTRSAPRRDPMSLARELTGLRQRAVVDVDSDALASLVEPGSAAAERDAELLEHLRASGDRYRGVELVVRSAELQRTKGETAVLRTTIDERAYTVRHLDGTSERQGARRGQQVDLVLVWHEGEWRVRDVLTV